MAEVVTNPSMHVVYTPIVGTNPGHSPDILELCPNKHHSYLLGSVGSHIVPVVNVK